ncbi:MAG: hypothetical protein RR851_13125 [Clostridium sp.]
MKVDLNYKECCILKHSLKRSIESRRKVIQLGIDTGRNEFIELQQDISCYSRLKKAIDKFKE